MAVRSKKRTDNVSLERVYRRLLALEKRLFDEGGEFGDARLPLLRDIAWGLRKDVNDARLEMHEEYRVMQNSLRALQPIVSHCERLMREKVTLQKQLAEANRYMAIPTMQPIDYGPATTRLRNGTVAYVAKYAPYSGPHSAYNCPCADSKCPGKQSYVDWKEKKAAAILNAAFCAFESTHRPGIRCNVCGHLEPNYGA